MDRQTRRNFLTCVAGGAAGLLTGSKPLQSRLFRNYDLHLDACKPIPLEWDDQAHVWVIAHNARNIYIGKSVYRIRRVDTPDGVEFSTWDEDCELCDMSCPIAGHDLRVLIQFEKSVQCNSDKMGYHHRYIIINNKNEYGFLTSVNPCWNFRASV